MNREEHIEKAVFHIEKAKDHFLAITDGRKKNMINKVFSLMKKQLLKQVKQ